MTIPHIGILFEFPTLNGGEHSMLAILRHLQQSGLRFTAIAPPDGLLAEELARCSIPTIPFCVRGPHGSKRKVEELQAELQIIAARQAVDILHSNSLSMTRLLGQSHRALPPRTIRTGHLRDIIKLSKAAVADMNRNSALIAVSEATRRFHLNQGLEPQRCHVIHNGVDLTLFCDAARPNLRETLFPDIPSSAKILLNVGQICLRKNQLNLAKSVCQLLRDRDDVYLVLVGERHSLKQESIEYENAVQQEFGNTGKRSHLKMMGFRNDIPAIMNAADVLVHTSHQEPFGRTLLEAASSELPIIATNVGGTAEMLRDGIDAILIESGEIEMLASTISHVLINPNSAQQRAASARERMVSRFSVKVAAERTREFWLRQLDGVSGSL